MKILLAVDGSEYSEAATQALALRMRPEGIEVLVLRVVEPRVFATSPQLEQTYASERGKILKEDHERAQESVNLASQALRAAHFHVNTRVVEGEARSAILEVAEEWGADLIVLGSHGRKGLQRFLLGSVAESIARHAGCAVQIVRLSRHRKGR